MTANLQLRRHRNPRAAPPGRSPKSPLATSNARSGWSLDRRPLRALLPGAWPLRPRAEHAASPLTSSSTTAPLDPASRPDPRLPPLGSVPAIPSSKTTASPKPGRLPSTSALSSVSSLDVRLRLHRDRNPSSRRARHRTRDYRRGRLRTSLSLCSATRGRASNGCRASPARCQRQGTGHDVSRRSLQSEQPTSTTTNLPSPCRGCRRCASSLRWTWRRPPSRVGALPAPWPPAQTCARADGDGGDPHTPGPAGLIGRVASRFHLCPSLTARTELSTRRQPSAHELGATSHPGLTGGVASLPDAPEGAARAVLGYARSRELFPGSIRSSTSCHRVAPTSGGWPDTARSLAGRGRRAIQAIPPRKPCIRASRTKHGRWICGPPYDQLALGARDVLARCSRRARELPGFTESAGEPSDSDTSSFARCPRSARPTRTEGRAALAAALPGPRARVPRRSAKSDRDRRYPRCFPSTDCRRLR